MKCKHCDGAGFFENGASQFRCVYCDGSGEVPMTNEEWFCGLSTEEKSRWLAGILFAYGDRWTREDEIWIRSETWMKWLKEKHDG